MSSQKKTCWAEKFYANSIFVTLYVFCNLIYLAYFLYTLHYPPYAHAIFYTHTLYTFLAMLHTKIMYAMTSNW